MKSVGHFAIDSMVYVIVSRIMNSRLVDIILIITKSLSLQFMSKTSDRFHVLSRIFHFLSRSFPRYHLFLFLNRKLQETAVDPPNFWVLVKISHLLLSNFFVTMSSLNFSKL